MQDVARPERRSGVFHETLLGDETSARLVAVDEKLVAVKQALGCPHCGGRLDRADFPRKPRGVPKGVEGFDRRFGLCCARDGCRRRTLPPSVRFVGRHVYVGVVVAIVSSALHHAAAWSWMQRRQARRWQRWWREVFGAGAIFADLHVRSGGVLVAEDLAGTLPKQAQPSRQSRAAHRPRRRVVVVVVALTGGEEPAYPRGGAASDVRDLGGGGAGSSWNASSRSSPRA